MGSKSKGGGSLRGCERPQQVAHECRAHGERHHRHEEERGDGEDGTGLLHSAQVHEHDERHQRHRQRDGVLVNGREGRGHLGDRRGDRHGHRQDVVHEQRRAGHLRGEVAQVVAGHDVGPAAARVGVDRLLVGERDDGEQDHDRHRDRHHEGEGGRARHRQDDHDLLRGVGGGRQRVGGEDGEADRLADRLVGRVCRGQRPADQPGAPVGAAARVRRELRLGRRCSRPDEGGAPHGRQA